MGLAARLPHSHGVTLIGELKKKPEEASKELVIYLKAQIEIVWE